MKNIMTKLTCCVIFLLRIHPAYSQPNTSLEYGHFGKTESKVGDDNTNAELLLDISDEQELADICSNQKWQLNDTFPYFRKSVLTGRAPKSCCFSPDGKTIAVCLLSDNGIDLYDSHTLHFIKRIHTSHDKHEDTYVSKEHFWGFAEGQYLDQTGDFWFTRMTTGEFFVYTPEEDTIRTYDARGSWTKAVSFSPDRNYVALSHWLSNTITIFHTHSRMLFRTIKTGKNPRGIAWIDTQTVAVALYATGDVQVFDMNTGEMIHTIPHQGGAARDVCFDPERQILYNSDMTRALVRKYDWREKKTIAVMKVDPKPNSIRLTADGNYLFVSCRGPNNPTGYTLRSPRNGSIYLIRTVDFKIIKKWAGGNQPTGLSISPDGKMLATTDFQDHRLNVYIIAK